MVQVDQAAEPSDMPAERGTWHNVNRESPLKHTGVTGVLSYNCRQHLQPFSGPPKAGAWARLLQSLALLLGAMTLLGAPGIATNNKKLLGAPGLTTRSKDATRGAWHRY